MQKILLIDDDPTQHELFSFFLEETFGAGSAFTSAMDLDEALVKLDRESFDVVFLDNRLHPYRSYTETISQIRAVDGSCPIYLISAAREHEKLGNYRDFGIVEAIDKFDLRKAISNGLLN